MANLTEDELFAMERAHRADEIERCALLCEMRGDISRASAAKLRKGGSYTVRALWPPFKKVTRVAPEWERQAKFFDDVGHAFDMVAKCIRLGYDTRKLQPHERDAEQMVVLRPGVDGDPSLHTVRRERDE